jgi:hypothetical protein
MPRDEHFAKGPAAPIPPSGESIALSSYLGRCVEILADYLTSDRCAAKRLRLQRGLTGIEPDEIRHMAERFADRCRERWPRREPMDLAMLIVHGNDPRNRLTCWGTLIGGSDRGLLPAMPSAIRRIAHDELRGIGPRPPRRSDAERDTAADLAAADILG